MKKNNRIDWKLEIFRRSGITYLYQSFPLDIPLRSGIMRQKCFCTLSLVIPSDIGCVSQDSQVKLKFVSQSQKQNYYHQLYNKIIPTKRQYFHLESHRTTADKKNVEHDQDCAYLVPVFSKNCARNFLKHAIISSVYL